MNIEENLKTGLSAHERLRDSKQKNQTFFFFNSYDLK